MWERSPTDILLDTLVLLHAFQFSPLKGVGIKEAIKKKMTSV